MPVFNNVLAGASGGAGAGGYEIERSLRFNSGDSAYLNRTPSAAGNRKTWTWSGWVKKGANGSNQMLFSSGSGGTNARSILQFTSSDVIEFGENPTGSSWSAIYTNAVYRDPSAWYHIVAVYDSTNATSTDRLRLYVNGVRLDSFSSSAYPSPSLDGNTNTTDTHRIGRYSAGNEQAYLDGCLADVHMVDGQALDCNSFAEFDGNGVWRPKEFAGTYGWFNNSQTWSSSVASITAGTPLSGKGLAQMFNANIDNSETTFSFYESNSSNSTVAFSPALTSTDGSNVKMYISAYTAGDGQGVEINGSAYTLTGVPGSGSAPKLFDLGTQSLSSISWTAPGGTNLRLSNPVVDGKILIDSGVSVADNSFRLSFADNSNDAALGADTSGNGNTWTVNNLTAFGRNISAAGSITSGAPYGTGFDWSLAFDGSITSAGAVGNVSGANKYVHTFTTSIPCTTAAFVIYEDYASTVEGGNGCAINGTALAATASANWTKTTNTLPVAQHQVGNYYVYTMNLGGSPLSSVGVSNSMRVAAVLVDGVPIPATSIGTDSLVDTPTNGTQTDTGIGGEVVANYPTWNPLTSSTSTFSDGNLKVTTGASYPLNLTNFYTPAGTGKWYWEFELSALGTGGNFTMVGMLPGDSDYKQGVSNVPKEKGGISIYVGYDGDVETASGAATLGTDTATFGVGDILGWAFDAENGTLQCYKNGVSQGTQFTNIRTDIGWVFCVTDYDGSSGATYIINFGQRAFAYAAPSGYKCLCTSSLPEPTIADGSTAMDIVTYPGAIGDTSITSLSFQPEFVWIKNRSANNNHLAFDAIRGATEMLRPDTDLAENTNTNTLKSFDSNGFTVGDNAKTGADGSSYVAWAWNAGANSNKTYAITVANPGSGNKYYADGAQQPTLTLAEGSTYKFDQSDSSNATGGGHPLRFSTNSDGTHASGGTEYTTGVTTAGTPGSAGAYTQIVIAASAPTLYAYCENHSGMGFQVNTSDTEGSTIVAGSLNSSTYTQSATYSNYIYGSVPTNKANAFDGSTSTYCESQATGTNLTLEFLPSPAISFTSKLEVYCNISAANTTASWDGNSVTPVQGQWTTVFSGSGTIDGTDSLVISTNGSFSKATIGGIRVDGKILVDSGVTPPNVPSIASRVMASPESGFSIVSYEGDGSASGTIGHGLNAPPSMIMVKNRDVADAGVIYHVGTDATSPQDYYLKLFAGNGAAIRSNTGAIWNDTSPTSSAFSVGTDDKVNASTEDYIAYCFSSVEGYSSVGAFLGNGAADGPFVYTGHSVAWVMIKSAVSGNHWYTFDSKRGEGTLVPNVSNQETDFGITDRIDLLSNGFKIRTASSINSNNETHVYLAFASNPFASNGGLAR